jgi:hypothetical protein
MKTKRIVTLLVSMISVALTPITWAAGHGGGGGFSGGGHLGGVQGGGFRGGGVARGAVGTRGGGVGFGVTRPRAGAQNFEGTGPRFSSYGYPSPPQRQVTGSRLQPSRLQTARQSDQRFPNLRNHVVSRHDANWHGEWDRRHAHFHNGRFFVFIDGFWCGLDDGFFPWDSLPYYANDYYPYDYYTDADPYDYNAPISNIAPADSAMVQAVQTQLARLGYYGGSIDGVFGPSTRDAVARYQIANQLNVTGSLSRDTLQSLGLPQAIPS